MLIVRGDGAVGLQRWALVYRLIGVSGRCDDVAESDLGLWWIASTWCEEVARLWYQRGRHDC